MMEKQNFIYQTQANYPLPQINQSNVRMTYTYIKNYMTKNHNTRIDIKKNYIELTAKKTSSIKSNTYKE